VQKHDARHALPAEKRMARTLVARMFLAMLWITLIPDILNSQATKLEDSTDDLGIRWIEVEAGTFTMGLGDAAVEVTIHRFMISATEVTFDQYDAFCDATKKPKPDDNGWGRGTRPVIKVSYDDAVEFCEWLSKETGYTIRLPNEAEWEYAAQGGHLSKGYIHSGGNNKDEVSWNEDNSENQTHPVGTKKPNELGIYDMSGNLWEWCADWPDTNKDGSPTDRQKSGDGAKRPLRGDSFDNPGTGSGFRISVRLEKDARHYNIGFRIVKLE
jgi:formylglycine-generating enzyme required for sulfatase activity